MVRLIGTRTRMCWMKLGLIFRSELVFWMTTVVCRFEVVVCPIIWRSGVEIRWWWWYQSQWRVDQGWAFKSLTGCDALEFSCTVPYSTHLVEYVTRGPRKAPGEQPVVKSAKTPTSHRGHWSTCSKPNWNELRRPGFSTSSNWGIESQVVHNLFVSLHPSQPGKKQQHPKRDKSEVFYSSGDVLQSCMCMTYKQSFMNQEFFATFWLCRQRMERWRLCTYQTGQDVFQEG